MITKGTKVMLTQTLYAVAGGIGVSAKGGKHTEIVLDSQQTGSAVTFPIIVGTEGTIIEVAPFEVVVQYYRRESFELINIRFKTSVFGLYNH